MTTLSVPAGTYVLSDPCYVVPNADWPAVCEAFDWPQGSLFTTINGHLVMGFNTAYGDGIYEAVGKGVAVRLGVDAGMIGLTAIELLAPDQIARVLGANGEWGLGLLVSFPDEVVCSSTPGGTLTFGDYVIETGDEE